MIGINYVARKKVTLGRVRITYEHRRKENAWGRFGGGWNWIVGAEIGGSTIIFNLLVASLRISWGRS